jgi:hypothetical protein
VNIHDVEQGSREWLELRFQYPTASHFDDLLTPAKLDVSVSAWKYLCRCFAEAALFESCDVVPSKFMYRGENMEKRARADYELHLGGIDVQQVGFVTNDDDTAGCSPDGLVGDDGGVEFKVPSAVNHAEYFLAENRDTFLSSFDELRGGKPWKPKGAPSVSSAHNLQVQGCLWICKRKWWDVIAWNPAIPMVVERVYRDEETIAKLERIVPIFKGWLDRLLVETGYREAVRAA